MHAHGTPCKEICSGHVCLLTCDSPSVFETVNEVWQPRYRGILLCFTASCLALFNDLLLQAAHPGKVRTWHQAVLEMYKRQVMATRFLQERQQQQLLQDGTEASAAATAAMRAAAGAAGPAERVHQ